MGQEIRRVPPDWEHPRQKCPHNPWAGGCDDAKRNDGQCYRPLYDETFEEAAAKWKADFAAWEAGGRNEHPEKVLRGEKNGMAKLTAETVRQARRMLAGGATFNEVAEVLSVNSMTIRRLHAGKTWGHVKD